MALVPYARQQLAQWINDLGNDVDDQQRAGEPGSLVTFAFRQTDEQAWHRATAVAVRDPHTQGLYLQCVDGVARGMSLEFPQRGIQFSDFRIDMTRISAEYLAAVTKCQAFSLQAFQQVVQAHTAQLGAQQDAIQRYEERICFEQDRLHEEQERVQQERAELIAKQDAFNTEMLNGRRALFDLQESVKATEREVRQRQEDLQRASATDKLQLQERIQEAKTKLQAEQQAIRTKKAELRESEKAILVKEQDLQKQLEDLTAKQQRIEAANAATLRSLEERKLQLSGARRAVADREVEVERRAQALKNRETAANVRHEEALSHREAVAGIRPDVLVPPHQTSVSSIDPTVLATQIAQAVAVALLPLLQKSQAQPPAPVVHDVDAFDHSQKQDQGATDVDDPSSCQTAMLRWKRRDAALDYEQRATSAFLGVDLPKSTFEAAWRRRLALPANRPAHYGQIAEDMVSRLLLAYDAVLAIPETQFRAKYIAYKNLRVSLEAASKLRLTLSGCPASAYGKFDADVSEARAKNRRGPSYKSLDTIVSAVMAKHPATKNGVQTQRRVSTHRPQSSHSFRKGSTPVSNGGNSNNNKPRSRASSRTSSRRSSPSSEKESD